MLKAVIFDLNGVFLESELLSDRFQKRFGVLSTEFIKALKSIMPIVRKPHAPLMFSLWQPYFQEWGISITEKDFSQFWFSGEQLNLDLVAYCTQLHKKGIRIFILSNNLRERTEYYRRHYLSLFKAVDKAYFSWETGFIKPDLRAYRHILKENELKPQECLYFDDSAENIAVAQSLGILAHRWKRLSEARREIEENLPKLP